MGNTVRDSNLASKTASSNINSDNRPVLTSIQGGSGLSASASKTIDPLDQITMRKTKRQLIREFGMVIAFALVIIAGFKLYHNSYPSTVLTLSGLAALFFSLCIWTPRLMIPVLALWMKIGSVLEKISTIIILGTLWFATFFPLGLIFKMIGKSTLTLGFEPEKKSYWEDCENGRNDFKLLERQF